MAGAQEPLASESSEFCFQLTEISLEPRFAASVLCACSGGWPTGQQAKGGAHVRTLETVGLPGPGQEVCVCVGGGECGSPGEGG